MDKTKTTFCVPEFLPEPGILAIKICVEGDVSLEVLLHALLVGDHVLVPHNQDHPLGLVLEGLDVDTVKSNQQSKV